MAKTTKKILEYQKIIEQLVSKKGYDEFELQDVCLHRIGHVACFESFSHALEDLVASGRVQKVGSTVFIRQ